jgi:hypothetical protein
MRTGHILIALAAVSAGCSNHNHVVHVPPDDKPPVAVITASQTSYAPLDTVHFDGNGSTDPDGTVIDWQWTITARPSGSNALPQPLGDGSNVDFFVDFAGDYTIELVVTDDAGKTGSTTLSWSAVPPQPLHTELAWDTNHTDVDLHFVDDTMGGTIFNHPYDCDFANKHPNWGSFSSTADDPSLDIDDKNGFGPEHINLSEPIDGHSYHIYVHYYDDGGNGASTAEFKLYVYGALVYDGTKLLTQTYKTWDAGTLLWQGTNSVFTENGNILTVVTPNPP